MLKNNFKMGMTKNETNEFSNRFRVILSIALCLTGLFCFSGVIFLLNGKWSDLSAISLAWKVLIYICMLCCFLSLIKIALDEKSFSKILSFCIRLIGLLLIIASFVFPRLNGYQFSGFAIMKYKDFVLIDGMILMIGLIILVFGFLLKDGYQMQSEIEGML